MRQRVVCAACIAIVALASLRPAGAAWLESLRHRQVLYFLHDAPAQIQRYDLEADRWLTPLQLSQLPNTFAIDDDGIYVGLGRTVTRMNLDGTVPLPIFNASFDVAGLAVNGPYLYVFESDDISSINKQTGSVIDQRDFFYSMRGLSIAPSVGKIFGRSTGVSPSDIVEVTFDATGHILAQNDSIYHGDYPTAAKTFVMPGEARVVDDSGIVYATSDLTYNNSLGGRFDDVSFYGNLPIVLRGDTLYAYDAAFLPTGNQTLEQPVERIFVDGTEIYGFYEVSTGVLDFTITPVKTLSPDEPDEPVDPNGLAYVPDQVALGNDGIVYLLSKAHLSVFRWSIEDRAYLPTIPLVQSPQFMAYTPVGDRLYLSYTSGLLTTIDLTGSLTETPFANSPQSPCGLATAGEFLFVCDPSGAWVSHFTYAPDGTLVSQEEWNYYSREYVWSPANRKMYFFRDDTSPNDILWEDIGVDGVLGTKQDSPYHSSAGIRHPIRVAPDGSRVVLGSGRLYDAITLDQTGSLANDIDDAAWLDGQLLTTRAASPYTEIQRWSTGNFVLEHSFFVDGEPVRVFGLEGQLLIITTVMGVPRFQFRGPDAGDLDEDQIPDHLDNCPEQSNPRQSDTDGDGVGDACNEADDLDGDDWADSLDNCAEVPNPDQANGDTDGLGDACDPYPEHDLRVNVETPALALTEAAVAVTFRLEDPTGQLLTEVSGARLTVTLGGAATFGSAALEGRLIEGGGSQRALLEFVDGRVVIEVSDLAEESVGVGGEDTERIGIELTTDVLEDFERSRGGFVASGNRNSWQHGIPTSGPGVAFSGHSVWATNLSGNYLSNSESVLRSPLYSIPRAGATLSFRSWFESCCDDGTVEVSTNDGASWNVLAAVSGYQTDWTLRTYDLSSYAGSGLIVRFRLVADAGSTYDGWHIDDFGISGLTPTIRFIDADGDADDDGLTNSDELDIGTDPFRPDSDLDGALDGQDNCPLAFNPDQLDVVHPNGTGDACEDPEGDGIVDGVDNCPDVANPKQTDQVHPNGIGDACDDPDLDAVFDVSDNCPDVANPDQNDADEDLVGSACDVCPATFNPAQAEIAACISVTEDGGHCVEAEIELVGTSVDGQIHVLQQRAIAPERLSFDVLATSCGTSDRLSFALNGTPLGSVDLDPGLHCSCLTPVQRLVVDDRNLLAAIWLPEGPNVVRLDKVGAGSGLAWVRLRLDGADPTQTVCIHDPGDDRCRTVDLCAAGYAFAPFSRDVQVNELIPEMLIAAASFLDSHLPDRVDINGLDPGRATLCVVADAVGDVRDCQAFTLEDEHHLAINGATCPRARPTRRLGGDQGVPRSGR